MTGFCGERLTSLLSSPSTSTLFWTKNLSMASFTLPRRVSCKDLKRSPHKSTRFSWRTTPTPGAWVNGAAAGFKTFAVHWWSLLLLLGDHDLLLISGPKFGWEQGKSLRTKFASCLLGPIGQFISLPTKLQYTFLVPRLGSRLLFRLRNSFPTGRRNRTEDLSVTC